MPSQTFSCTKYGGLSLVLAGVILIVGIFLHPDETDSNFMFDSNWTMIHVALGISILLAMYGFIALMHHVTDRVSFGANLAVGVLIGALALLSGLILFVEGFVFPTLGANATFAAALSPTGPLLSGNFGVSLTIVMALFSVAAIGTGYYIGTISGLTQWSGWLLFAAPLIAFSPPLPHTVFLVGGLIFGIGLIVIGKDLKKIGGSA